MHYFSIFFTKNLPNNAVIFRAFGKFGNFEKFLKVFDKNSKGNLNF